MCNFTVQVKVFYLQMSRKKLILIVGPTAVGKTGFCIKLAKKLGTEIISCDSRQFYREMSVGTAKPSEDELAEVKHHFINSHSINEHYSAGDFEQDALKLMSELFQKYDYLIMTGGSGLFAKVITEGIDDMPSVPPEFRQKLMSRLELEGLQRLVEELKKLDPEYAGKVDLKNSQRVVRALEMCHFTGQTFSEYHKKNKVHRPFQFIKIGLDRPREELYERINSRMEKMLEDGLEEEAKNLISFRKHPALKTLGYKEIFSYLDGEYDRKRMIELLKQNSRRFAKRQLTWFRNQDTFKWFNPDEEDKILKYIEEQLSDTKINS